MDGLPGHARASSWADLDWPNVYHNARVKKAPGHLLAIRGARRASSILRQ
jgi:hypothetical protein